MNILSELLTPIPSGMLMILGIHWQDCEYFCTHRINMAFSAPSLLRSITDEIYKADQ